MRIVGSPESDTLTGSLADDLIPALGGNDEVDANDGADTVYAGDGDDTVSGGIGADVLYGAQGNDALNGNSGDDELFGGLGSDVLAGGNGNDILVGANGDDLVFGGSGNDVSDGGWGSDTIFGGAGNDLLRGDYGRDLLIGGIGADTLSGGWGQDTLNGGLGADVIYGGVGRDFATGGSGADIIFGGDGNDTLSGDGGRDIIRGGSGKDVLRGGSGSDEISGGTNDDTVYAGTGYDTVSGGSGSDVIFGGDGNDSLQGGDGDDTLFGGNGDDTLVGSNGDEALVGGNGNDLIISGVGGTYIDGGAGNDLVVYSWGVVHGAGQAIPNFVLGGDGHDTLRLSLSADVFQSEAFQLELLEYRRSHLGEESLTPFGFLSISANLRNFESLEVFVDGMQVVLPEILETPLFAEVIEDGAEVTLDLLDGIVGSGGQLSIELISDLPAGLSLSGSDLTIDPTDDLFQLLREGEVFDVPVSYFVYEDSEVAFVQTANFSITGTNDAALITGETARNVSENTFALFSGNLNVTDIDGPDSFLGTVNRFGAYGTYTVRSDGDWFYQLDELNPEVDALAFGDSLIDTISIFASDGTIQDITITINGVSDILVSEVQQDSDIRGFSINGESASDWSGVSVSGAGDVNGDGLDDLLIGAMGDDPNGSNSGASYVVFGKASGVAIDLADISSGNGGFVINGVSADDQVGYSVSGAGDVNGDGLHDLIVGARGTDGNPFRGQSFVVFGKADGTVVELSDVNDGLGGFRLPGGFYPNLGAHSVSDAGDVNGDGLSDLVIRAVDTQGLETGVLTSSYVVFGKADGTAVEVSDIVSGIGGFAISDLRPGDRAGYSVSAAGDVNGDGLDDLIIGAFGSDANGQNSGQSFVVFGKSDSTNVNLFDIETGIGGYVLEGVPGSFSGGSVSNAGDVNGDGLDDMIVGATGVNGSRGASYVVYGKADGVAVSLADVAAGIGGFVINGISVLDQTGSQVSGAGDLNGDGYDDLIVGVSRLAGSSINSGVTYVVFGKFDGTPVELADISLGIGGFVLNGADSDDSFGGAISDAGDVNGDGFDDLIVGARGVDTNGSSSGASYVFFGGDFTGVSTHLGTTGADTISGSIDDDVIFAGTGDDTISGGGGNDRFSGGQGDDLFVFSNSESAITIIDFEDDLGGQDVLDVSEFFSNFSQVQAVITAVNPGGRDVLIQLDEDDSILLEDFDIPELSEEDFLFAI